MNKTQPIIQLADGNHIPQLGLGVWQATDKEARQAVCHALQVGYRHVDTAAIYENEESVGAGVRDSGVKRDEVFITTKVWNESQGFEAAGKALEKSLRRLQMDYVALLLIHWPVPATNLFVDTWRALVRAKEQGKVRSIGVSNFNPIHLQRLIAETGVTPVMNQVELHPFFQQSELRRYHDELAIRTQAWSPLGQGEALASPVIVEIATRHQRTPAQVIIRWHLQLGNVAIPKSITPTRIEENIKVFDFELTAADMAAIQGLDSSGGRMGPVPEEFN